MPEITTIETIKDSKEHGDKIRCVKGRIVSFRERKEGTSKHGDWSVQNVKIKDATGEIEIALWNQEEVTDRDKGKTITLLCTETEKHGRNGVEAVDETWTDKDGEEHTERKIKVTKSAKVIIEGKTPSNDDDEPKTKPSSQPSRSVAPSYVEAKKSLARLAALYACSRRAAVNAIGNEINLGLIQEDEAPEIVASAASCVFIEAVRHRYQDSMPTLLPGAPTAKKEEPEESEEEDIPTDESEEENG